MRLTQNEVKEAVKEWLAKRGVDASKNEVKFQVVANGATLAGGILYTEVEGIELPVRDGPYR
jgi:hypothetical protein